MATQTIVISDVTYEVTESLADDGLPILCKLVNLAAGGPELKSLSLTGLILSAVGNKDLSGVVRDCCDEFGKMTQINKGGKKIQLSQIFTTHFQGKYRDLISWLAFALKVNFGEGFLELYQKLVDSAQAKKTESKSTSLPESDHAG